MIDKALDFATIAHNEQKRKYTYEPYIEHPKEVAQLVQSVPHSIDMVCAALLHDVVEDTKFTLDDIRENFGDTICKMVEELTQISKPSDGNRKTRKSIDRDFLAKASPQSKTIKLADIIVNSKSIKKYDEKFWKVYRLEIIDLLEVLKEGDPMLLKLAKEQIGIEK